MFDVEGYGVNNTLNITEPAVGDLPAINFDGAAGTNTLNIDKTARASSQTVAINNSEVDLGTTTVACFARPSPSSPSSPRRSNAFR